MIDRVKNNDSGPGPIVTALCLAAIMVMAAGLRFDDIRQVSPILADEADYTLEARYIYSAVRGLTSSLLLKREEARTGRDLWRLDDERKRIKDQMLGRSPWYARPGQIYLLALVMAATDPDNTAAGPMLSALFGVLTIPLVFFLGRRLGGKGAGLVAAGLLAMSGYHIVYSRTGLTETVTTFLVCAATLAYVRSRDIEAPSRKRCTALAGLLMGTAFLTHYRMVLIILVIAGIEIVHWARTRRREPGAGGGLLWFAAMACLPVIVCEIPYYAAVLAFHRLGELPTFLTYFEQLLVNLVIIGHTNLGSTAKHFGWSNLLTYPYLLWWIEGPAVTLAVVPATAMAVRRFATDDRIVLVLLFVPMLILSIGNPNARYATLAIPFVVALVGALLANLWSWRRWPAIAACVLVLACSGFYAWRAARLEPAGYGRAMVYVELWSDKHIATHKVVSQAYLGVASVPEKWPASDEELLKLYEEGHRFYVIDFLKVIAADLLDRFDVPDRETVTARFDLMERIEKTCVPVFETVNPPVTYLQNAFEVNHNFLMCLDYRRRILDDPELRTIRVYDIGDYLEATGLKPEEREETDGTDR